MLLMFRLENQANYIEKYLKTQMIKTQLYKYLENFH